MSGDGCNATCQLESSSTSCIVDDPANPPPCASADGAVEIEIPPDSLDDPTPITITQGDKSDFGLTRCADPAQQNCTRDIVLASIGPAGTTFDPPARLTFRWKDDNNDGEVDDQPGKLREKNLRLWKDGAPITARCQDPPHNDPVACLTGCNGLECCCDPDANTWTLGVKSLSEFIVGVDVATQGVGAKKLVVVDKMAAAGTAKTVYVAKGDPAITKGTGTDLDALSVRLELVYVNGAADGSFSLPAGRSVSKGAGWVVNKDTVAKYVNKDAPNGPTATKVAVLKPGKLLKLVGKGLGDEPFDILNGGDPTDGVMTAYCVNDGGEEVCHCAVFTSCVHKAIAGGTGAKLVCKEGVSDGNCALNEPVCRVDMAIPPAGGTVTGTTSGASARAASCGSLSGDAPEAVYEWTPTTTGQASFSTCGSTFDTVLAVYQGPCGSTELTCNDDFARCGDGTQSVTSAFVIAGETYTIVVDGSNGGQSGAYTLTVTAP